SRVVAQRRRSPTLGEPTPWRSRMGERPEVIVERMPDTGQWFEPGARAEYFPVQHDPRRWALEAAALGSYEVLDCHRVTIGHQPWLEVRLQRLSSAGADGADGGRRPGSRRAGARGPRCLR